LFALFNLIFIILYLYLICSNPGYVSEEDKDENYETLLFTKKDEFKHYCFKCCVHTTDDLKHCSICDKCCKGFDHHCYWVNNCIGINNYYLFIFFLIITYIDVLFKLFITLFFLYFEFGNDNKKEYDFFGISYLSFMTNDYYICTIIIIFLLLLFFFVISLFFLLKLHFKVCWSRLHNNSLNSNRKTVILAKVNNDDLLSSESISESEI
jgi:small-conductance mechanosensitive channel